eukprot:6482682-Amphidinium_carterae.2
MLALRHFDSDLLLFWRGSMICVESTSSVLFVFKVKMCSAPKLWRTVAQRISKLARWRSLEPKRQVVVNKRFQNRGCALFCVTIAPSRIRE